MLGGELFYQYFSHFRGENFRNTIRTVLLCQNRQETTSLAHQNKKLRVKATLL